jgi:hypothetical protein
MYALWVVPINLVSLFWESRKKRGLSGQQATFISMVYVRVLLANKPAGQ